MALNYLFKLLSIVAIFNFAAAYNCIDFFVPINVTAPSYGLAFPPFKDRYQAVQSLLGATGRDAASAPSPLTGTTNITQTFQISTKYCTPSQYSNRSSTVQLLSPGLCFDKHYWDFGGPSSDYNYILAATDAGYSTLSYDRIGTGLSTSVYPYTIAQAPMEVAVLAALTEKLRLGDLRHDIAKPDKVVHVGHSFGSIVTNALVASHPTLSDGIVLTGFSQNFEWVGQWLVSTVFRLAEDNIPHRFPNASTGYVTWGDQNANQYGFSNYPNFDPAMLAHSEATKWPFAVGELLTGPPAVSFQASAFKKPVLMISGVQDVIFCGGDCRNVVTGSASSSYFPVSSVFESYLQPDTAHNMNMHYNSTGTYDVITNFLKTHLA